MTAQDLVQGTRLERVRELKADVDRLAGELARTREELESLRAHFALALEAARDADRLPAGGRLVIVDGWNALLGSASVLEKDERHANAHLKKEKLRALARAWLDTHPLDGIWLVFDGAQADGRAEGRLRESYTGGEGPHRADRMVCDYLRMRRLTGSAHGVTVLTEDADFRREAERLGAAVGGVGLLRG